MNTTMTLLTHSRFRIALAACVITLTGCATTAPTPEFVEPLPPSALVDGNDVVAVTVIATSGVTMTPFERERLAQVISAKIDAAKLRHTDVQNARNLRIDVTMTRYDKGNAFARMMLAGLGQIHIEARATLFMVPENRPITQFTVAKTFAWGGIYGASQSIEDVEEGFSQAVADAVTESSH